MQTDIENEQLKTKNGFHTSPAFYKPAPTVSKKISLQATCFEEQPLIPEEWQTLTTMQLLLKADKKPHIINAMLKVPEIALLFQAKTDDLFALAQGGIKSCQAILDSGICDDNQELKTQIKDVILRYHQEKRGYSFHTQNSYSSADAATTPTTNLST